MGCDIRGGYEAHRKVFKDDDRENWRHWKYAGEIDPERRYNSWYAIAGVRYGEVEPIWAGRGLPVGEGNTDEWEASEANLSMLECDGDNAHSTTWVRLDEMKAANLPELFKWYIEEMEIIRNAYNLTDRQVRMICWFDN